MRYTVRWRGQAPAELTAVLVSALDKQAVLWAARGVGRRLRRRPLDAGESRGVRHRRLAYLWPLTVLITVDRADRTVYIERVRWIGPVP